jgi:cytochrome c-type biogenesis protein CcmH
VKRIVLLGAGLALIATAAVLLGLALAPRAEPAAAERVRSLAAEMRCPDCQALSVAESRTQAAAAIQQEIERQVAAGRSDDEVRDYFVASYGEWILLAPPEPLVWLLPAGSLLAGLAVLLTWYATGSRRRGLPVGARAPGPVAEEDRRRIREELEALDG